VLLGAKLPHAHIFGSGYSSNGSQWAVPSYWKLRTTMAAPLEPQTHDALGAWREALLLEARRASFQLTLTIGPRI